MTPSILTLPHTEQKMQRLKKKVHRLARGVLNIKKGTPNRGL